MPWCPYYVATVAGATDPLQTHKDTVAVAVATRAVVPYPRMTVHHVLNVQGLLAIEHGIAA